MFALEAPFSPQRFHELVSDEAICQVIADEKLAAGEISPEQYRLILRQIRKNLNHAQRCSDRGFELFVPDDLEPASKMVN